MLDISHLTIHPNMQPRNRVLRVILPGLAAILFQQRRVRIHDRRSQVQDTTDRNRVPESTRIGADERGAGVRETRRAAERQLERLLQVEAAEDHGLVPVAVLRLHDGRRRELRLGHGEHVARLPEVVVRVVVR